MKTKIGLILTSVIFIFSLWTVQRSSKIKMQRTSEYIIIGWNDLGMHCANKDFSKMAVLPPYNNLKAHIIKKGSCFYFP